MATIKFSQFVTKSTAADVAYIVGYNGTDNVQITPSNFKLAENLTTAEINAIASPAEGLTVYNTTLNTLCFYNGTNWQRVTSANM